MTCSVVDDVLVSGRDDEEHYNNLDRLFQRFLEYGLRVKAPKCLFYVESVVYMGRRLSHEGMLPTSTSKR